VYVEGLVEKMLLLVVPHRLQKLNVWSCTSQLWHPRWRGCNCLIQRSATFLLSRVKNKLCRVWRAYLFSTNNSVPLLFIMLLKHGNLWNLNQI